ncbi:MAG: ATPase central domain protein, partial [Myxococcales bacterium]|nr:ATPase central domain protein [Myxococcales bacterium]
SLARRYAMSGGYIRNAALRAAFLAADEDSEITAAHLERAARVEYEGLGKIAA